MSWLYSSRPSFTHVSTHQTYVGKALYEHARDCATIAAVACMSSSLLKSSLGPNLLALIQITRNTIELFEKIFIEHNPHMQFTQKLDAEQRFVSSERILKLVDKLCHDTSFFSSSLQQLGIPISYLSSFKGFRILRNVTVKCDDRQVAQLLPVVKSLPSLTELKLQSCRDVDADFFRILGDLEDSLNLVSLTIEVSTLEQWSSEGFQKDFCGRLLSKNRLTKLDLDADCWKQMNGADEEAFVNAGMTNLKELEAFLPAKWIHGEGFVNLKVLSVTASSDADLVNIGNHCLLLEVLRYFCEDSNVTGSFLTDPKLVENAFVRLRDLHLSPLTESRLGKGFVRLRNLENISFYEGASFDGPALQHLPIPEILRSISLFSNEVTIAQNTFSAAHVIRFVHLENLTLNCVQLSDEDILSFAVFKQLKSISLNRCGERCSSSAPFRILCLQLPNLENLECCGTRGEKTTQWYQDDVDAILLSCRWMRRLSCLFGREISCDITKVLQKKHPHVRISGIFIAKGEQQHQ